MSIVEKAAEKLKTLQPEPAESPPPPPRIDPPLSQSATSTVERLQARAQAADHVVASSEPWPIDWAALRHAGLLPAEDGADERLANEMRRIKRPLLDNADGKSAEGLVHGERIVVTSAVPGEGKTFAALNLALSLAREPDFEVLLIDADVPKSDLTGSLGLMERPGLMDVLVDERRQPAEVIVRTDVPNLLVVPVGQRHPLTAELFGSRRMEYVLEELGARHRRRLLVFDSSPLLATPEAPVLTTHMGQVVMMVAAGRTGRQQVDMALQNLEKSQYVGLILNKSRLPPNESHYDGYGYGYGYHYGHEHVYPASRQGAA